MQFNELATQIGNPHVQLIVRATILLLSAALIARLCRKASAAVRHAIWLATMVAVMLLPIAMWILPNRSIAILPHPTLPEMHAVDHVRPPGDTPISVPPAISVPPSKNDDATTRSSSLVSHIRATDTGQPQNPVMSPSEFPELEPPIAPVQLATPSTTATVQPWTSWITAGFSTAWIIGIVILASRFVRNHRTLKRLRKRSERRNSGHLAEQLTLLHKELSLRRKVELREHTEPIIPITWGMLRPVIVLPRIARNWSTRLQRVVLLHELIHIRRGDIVAQRIARLACVLYWFHPLVWYGAAQMRQQQEQACDDAIVPDRESASCYAEQLLSLAKLCCCPTGIRAAVSMAEGSSLERRVNSLFDTSRAHGPLGNGILCVLILGSLLVVSAAASIQPVAVQASDPASSASSPDLVDSPPDPGSMLTSTAALERWLALKPSFGPSQNGLRLAAVYATRQRMFRSSEHLPVELFLLNSSPEELLLRITPQYDLLSQRSANSGSVSVSTRAIEQHIFRESYTVRLQPGAACVFRNHGIGVVENGNSTRIEDLSVGNYRVDYALSVTVLSETETVSSPTTLRAQPLKFSIVGTERNERSVQLPLAIAGGLISPERLQLLRPTFGEPQRGIQLGVAVSTLKRSFAMNEIIPLTLCYRNVGNKPLTFNTHLDFVSDPPHVIDQTGAAVPVTFIMHWMFIGPTTITLQPGETWGIPTVGLGLNGQARSALTNAQPGGYTLHYTEGIWDPDLIPREKPSRTFGPTQTVMQPTWSESLTTGGLKFEIASQPNGKLRATVAADTPNRLRDVSQPQKISLDDHVLWWERAHGIQVGFRLIKTADPLNQRVPDDSTVTYQVVVRNVTDQTREFFARALSFDGLEVPGLISADDIVAALQRPKLNPAHLARPTKRTSKRADPIYALSLAPGEAAFLPGHDGMDQLHIKIGGEPAELQPFVDQYKPEMNWLVQPVTIWDARQIDRSRLKSLLGRYRLTRVLSDGTIRSEPAVRITGLQEGKALYPRIQLEVGTLNAAAFRNAEHAVWGNVEQGMQCGLRLINRQKSFRTGDTLKAEVLWRNTSEAVVSTALPRQLDLYPSIENTSGDYQMIDFGARFDLLPYRHEFQPGEVRSLGLLSIELVGENTPAPETNAEPAHIHLMPGNYRLTASGGVGRIDPRSGPVMFQVWEPITNSADRNR